MVEKLEVNKIFRLKKDLTQFKVGEIENGKLDILLWMEQEKCWRNTLDKVQERCIIRQLEKGEWNYLFVYQDKEFSAKNINNALDKFLDVAWGDHYERYLEELGFKNMNTEAIKDLKDISNDKYCQLKQKLQNGSILQTEVWENDNGTYQGVSHEIAVDFI